MTYVHRAQYYYNIISETDVVEILYSKYTADGKWTEFTDYFNSTWPVGDWKSLDFTKYGDFPEYKHFLNTMVHKDIEIARKIAYVSLDEAICDSKDFIKMMNCIKILDNTFVPPVLNKNCKWQMELLDTIVHSSFNIIDKCRNKSRLDRYFKVFQLL